MQKQKKTKKVKAWGGILYDRLYSWKGVQYGYDEEPVLCAVFRNKKLAENRFRKVVPVTITYTI
jgi:hypothetical protein